MATLVYNVVAVRCISLAFVSQEILSPLTLFSAAATEKGSVFLSNLLQVLLSSTLFIRFSPTRIESKA